MCNKISMKIIELGGGQYPEPGTINIDCLSLPTTHIKLNFVEENLPFDENSVDGVIMNHSIEHIPLLKMSHVMSEVFRVLKPGSSVKIRTPNLRYIISSYLNGSMEREQPKDMANWLECTGSWNPSVWTNLRLFSGQDYHSNTHYICFDHFMLEQMLKHYGFSKCDHFHGRDYQTGEIRMEAFKP